MAGCRSWNPRSAEGQFPAAVDIAVRCAAPGDALVARKRQWPGQDVISDLLATAEQDPDLDNDGIAMLAAALLFAGHETTVAAIDRGVVLLATHPDQFAELRRDPSRVAPAMEEILRSSLPLPASTVAGDQAGGLPRYATEGIEFRGVRIAAGELVLLGLRNANIDARRFHRTGRVRHQPRPESAPELRARTAVPHRRTACPHRTRRPGHRAG